MPDCSWGRSFRRALPRSLYPWRTGQGVFYAYYLCGELVKTVPTDAMIFNRQTINQSINQCFRLVSSLSPPVVSGKRGDYCSFCGVSFPVIFVYFRSAPELNIFSGIMRLCCDFLLDCLAGDVIGFAFLSITRLGFPAARAVSARVMSSGCHRSRRVACLPYPVMSSIAVIRFAFPCSPFIVSLSRPARRVGGRGADGAACLPHDVVARGVALVSWPCLGCGAVSWFICRASVVLPVLLLLMRWRRGTGTAPM